MLNSKPRRDFLRQLAALPALAMWPPGMPRLAFAPAHTAPRGDVLVCVFLRGAADALNIIVPHGDEDYYRARPTLAIPRPDDHRATAGRRTLDLDGFFGLHPALAPLTEFWQAEHFAAVHALGAAEEERSHFKAMALMERGVGDETGPASGWLGRHLAALDTGNNSPLRAVSIGEMVVRSLRGPVPATALRSIADFHLGGDARAIAEMQAALSTLYAQGNPLDAPAAEALQTLETLTRLNEQTRPDNVSTIYPEDEFGRGLQQVARLIKAEVGLEVACLDLGGWDTHIAQGGSEGLMARQLGQLAEGLAAFYTDLGAATDRLLVVVMSEFGRRVSENGGFGTDHGYGGAMLLLGGQVVGGRVHGHWPGLAPEQRIGPGDLAVTTDYRDVLAEVVSRHLNNPHLNLVFPNYQPVFQGVVR